MLYGIIIVEEASELRTIVEEVEQNEFQKYIYPRLANKHGILKLGKNRIDLTHVTKWVLFEIETKKPVKYSS